MRNKLLLVLVLLVALVGCAETKLYHATAAEEGSEGMRVDVKGGTFSGGAGAALENVGTYTAVPSNWTGPVPPGWVVYEGPPKPPELEVDEGATPSPPPG